MRITKNLKSVSFLVLSLVIFSLLITTYRVAGESDDAGILPITNEISSIERSVNTPLVVAYGGGSGNFSPFSIDSSYDVDVVKMTQIYLLTTDRRGEIISNAIDGETRDYNGTDYLYKGAADTSVVYDELSDTTTYTAQLRQDIQFSDGNPVTADDIIFTYYTLLDPSYDGTNILYSFPILGLREYQTQTTSVVYDKYDALFDDIYAAGHDHVWTAADEWTQAQQDDVWARFDSAILTETEKIVEYVNQDYFLEHYAESRTGYTPEEITGNEGMEIMFGMVLWGFGDIDEYGALVTNCTSTVFDLVESFPTYEDFKAEILACYNWDIQAAFPYESADGTDVFHVVKEDFICYWGPLDPLMGDEGIPNIAGIVKVDGYTVAVTIEGFSTSAAYTIFDVPVAPLHYYGDQAKYDYENNMFGFDFGDLSTQNSKSGDPMGAGPYQFNTYYEGTVNFVANELYYKGAPKIGEIQFVPMASNDVPSAIQQGYVDLGEINYSASLYDEIKTINTNGEMTGDVITSYMTENLGYGYIGINASTVNVGGDPDSDASKYLRRAFATIFAVHRYVAIDAYYGDGAHVIEYPISSASWAAPQPTDAGYEIAYSTDVNGDPIYTSGMTTVQKVAAAQAAALGFFEAAGYTVEVGMITAAPAGAKMSYMGYVPAEGTGDHPNYGVYLAARASLANIGMDFQINDPEDWNVMLDAIDANEQEIWTMAWGSAIDPDMYQVYHSDNIPGSGGTDSNHYNIADSTLDQLIIDARMSTDQAYRKTLYKQCLDIILGWGVEIPSYQRFNATVYSTDRINTNSITPDMTPFWDWQNDIELLKMNSPKIGAYLDIDVLYGFGWVEGTQVTLTIGADHWTEHANEHGWVFYYLEEPLEVCPGLDVEMSGSIYDINYSVVDLNVTAYDEEYDTLSGTANPGELEIEVCDDSNCETQYPIADGSGNWSVDLVVVDLAPGSYAYLHQIDEDGNFTQNYWYIEDPYMNVSSQEDSVAGYFWPANTEVTLIISDARDTWVGNTNKRGEVIFELEGFEILPEQEVEMSGGTYTKMIVVKQLEVTDIDQDLDTISGITEPLSELKVLACAYVSQSYTCEVITTVSDDQGNWIADFYTLIDISPGSEGNVQLIDEDEDSTMVTWNIPFADEGSEIFLPLILH